MLGFVVRRFWGLASKMLFKPWGCVNCNTPEMGSGVQDDMSDDSA